MNWPDSFQANRWIRTVNLVLQALLFLVLFAGINYLALRHTWRFDLTRTRFFSLSAETRAYLDQLHQPVHIVVAFEPSPENEEVAQARRDVLNLLREYSYATRQDGAPAVTVEELDVFQQRRRAENLGITGNNVIVVTSGDRRRTVSLAELYLIRKLEKRAFVGERTFTAAILDVTNTARQKIYFLIGHSEMDPASTDEVRGLSQFYAALRARNFEIDSLDLSRVRRVPDDAALLFGISPRTAYLPQEQELLRDYLTNRAGRLLLALDPAPDRGSDTGLGQLFDDWGLQVTDSLVVDPDPAARAEGGDLILRAFAKHPITQVLLDNSIAIVTGSTRVVRPAVGRAPDPTLKVTGLIAAPRSAWGETSFRTSRFWAPDAADFRGNPDLHVAAVSERVTAANLPFNVRGGRLVIFGTADLFANNRLGALGNNALALAAVNWAVDRDAQINIPPRPLEKFQLTLSQTELGKLRLGLLLIVPGALALLGLIVYWTRRS